jgi:CheY-like chemotaxis protein
VDVLTSYKDVLEFNCSDTIPQLIDDMKSTPANLALINASSQEKMTSVLEAVQQSVRDTPLVGWILPKQAWADLSQSVVKTLVKPITKSELVRAVADLPRPVHKILIADDDPEITQLYSRMLKSDKAAPVIEIAADGFEALEKMHEFHPDLVMLDISMSELDGFEVLSRKDADRAVRSIPVMVISAIDLRYNPLQTKLIVGTMADGIGPAKLVSCAIGLSELLLKSEMMLDQARV